MNTRIEDSRRSEEEMANVGAQDNHVHTLDNQVPPQDKQVPPLKEVSMSDHVPIVSPPMTNRLVRKLFSVFLSHELSI